MNTIKFFTKIKVTLFLSLFFIQQPPTQGTELLATGAILVGSCIASELYHRKINNFIREGHRTFNREEYSLSFHHYEEGIERVPELYTRGNEPHEKLFSLYYGAGLSLYYEQLRKRSFLKVYHYAALRIFREDEEKRPLDMKAISFFSNAKRKAIRNNYKKEFLSSSLFIAKAYFNNFFYLKFFREINETISNAEGLLGKNDSVTENLKWVRLGSLMYICYEAFQFGSFFWEIAYPDKKKTLKNRLCSRCINLATLLFMRIRFDERSYLLGLLFPSLKKKSKPKAGYIIW